MKRQSTKLLWDEKTLIDVSVPKISKVVVEEKEKLEDKLIRQTIVLEIDTRLFWTLCFIAGSVLFLAFVVLFSTVQNIRLISNASRKH